MFEVNLGFCVGVIVILGHGCSISYRWEAMIDASQHTIGLFSVHPVLRGKYYVKSTLKGLER